MVVDLLSCRADAAGDMDIPGCAEERRRRHGMVLGNLGSYRNTHAGSLLSVVCDSAR